MVPIVWDQPNRSFGILLILLACSNLVVCPVLHFTSDPYRCVVGFRMVQSKPHADYLVTLVTQPTPLSLILELI